MFFTINPGETTRNASDALLLQSYLQLLVGEPFLQLRVSYGDELTIHFGGPTAYSSPKLKHLVKGSFILGFRASRWFLHSNPKALVVVASEKVVPEVASKITPLSSEDLEKSQLIEPGAAVRTVNVIPFNTPPVPILGEQMASGFGVAISFSDGSSILLIPDSVDRSDSDGEDIADWELFTPYERYLSVGPGAVWSYLPTDSKAA